jgi:dihydroxy-acid dehydratase
MSRRKLPKAGLIGLVQEGDTVDIDIPNRSIRLAVGEAELAARRAAMEAKGTAAWKPEEKRKRKVTTALRAMPRWPPAPQGRGQARAG